MKLKSFFLLAALAAVSFNTEVSAEVRLSPLFTDNMVLQQKTDAPVWGTAEPGKTVTVVTSWNKASYKAVAGDDGKWMVKVSTPKAGGPYSLTITEEGGKAVLIGNVLVGEVWLCSGQSNMEMPVKGWGKVMNYEKELKDAAKYPKIRLLEVQREVSPQPLDGFKADADGWMVCSPETLEEFSATAYFFGREIHLKKNVPVGLINTSWGGTIIEAWMSKTALEGVKDLQNEAQMVSEWPASKEERYAVWKEGLSQWDKLYAAFNDAYLHLDTYFPSKFQDDSDWDTMRLPGPIEALYPGLDGHVLLRKTVDIPQAWEGKPLKLHIAAVDDWDIMYFNDVKFAEGSGWDVERSYEVPAGLVKAGKAILAMRLIDTGNAGAVSGDDDSFYLEGPDGERIMLAGEWKAKVAADLRVLPPKPLNIYDDPNWSTVLYNAMINPLVPYALKGAIWYQGCSNTDRAYQYRDLMSLMIDDWRRAWGYDFPFYITQISSWMDHQTAPEESSWAELREAQDIASRVTANSGLAVTTDIGDALDIHPKNKQEVGRRLALQALNKTYGMSVECSGPVYDRYEVDGNVVRIYFRSVGKGLVAKGGKLEGFTVAGADRKFHWAEAQIKGNCVELTCSEVERPLAVRYAWANNPVGNLFNSAGLPAGPFRTDDWPGVTMYSTSRF